MKTKTLRGIPIHQYVEAYIWRINDMLRGAGCVNAKALCKHEEESKFCKFSCVAEDGVTPFKVTLGKILGIKIRDISWTSNDTVGIVFDDR